MKSSRPIRLVLHIATMLFVVLPLHALAEWVAMKDCRLVPHDSNDGDSFHFEFNGEQFIARLYFVDCAETDNQVPDRIVQQMEAFGVSEDKVYKYGHDAKMFAERVLARPFTVITRFHDARGRSRLPRHYAFVFPNGSRQDLGSLLTEAGLARSFGQAARNDLGLDRAHYDRLESKARREGMGIFGGRRHSEVRQEPDAPRTSMASIPQDAPAVSPPTPVDLYPAFSDMLIANLRTSNDALFRVVHDYSENRPSSSSGARININTASLSELESLPGIGAVTAKRIVENRPYSSIEDLRRVPRIGEFAIRRLKPLVEY